MVFPSILPKIYNDRHYSFMLIVSLKIIDIP